MCGAGLDALLLNVGLGHLLPRCCLGTRWVSESQGCVSPVQRTPTNEIFRLWALCSPCCLSSQVLWEEHTSPKGSLQLTTFHVHRCSHAARLWLDTHTWWLHQFPRDCKHSPPQLGLRCQDCFCVPGVKSHGRELHQGHSEGNRGVHVNKRKVSCCGYLCLISSIGPNSSCVSLC